MQKRLNSLIKSVAGQFLLGRTISLVLIYSAIFAVSLWIGYLLRWDFVIPETYQLEYVLALPLVVAIKLFFLMLFGQFGILLSYFRLPDLNRIGMALTLSSILLVQAWYIMPDFIISPRSVLLADYIFSLFFLTAFRMSLRVYRERYMQDSATLRKRKRVAILGAGMTGANLAYDLLSRAAVGLRPVVFLDDNRKKWRHRIHGIPVAGGTDELEEMKKRFGIQGIILAMPTASPKRILEITEAAGALGLSTDIMPSVSELATGKVRASRIRPVEIEDLLGREQVDLDTDDIRALIQGKVVMVTGAGGSIGSELCRQIFSNVPERLLLVDRCEVQLYAIEMDIRRLALTNGNVLPLIADVCDEPRMRELFSRYKPDIVFHAAAHKHVPMMEHQPVEALKNNTLGTRLTATLAKEYEVERFIFISTDKAINPTNVMGASKRMAEIFLQSYNQSNGSKTRFMAVRFGNVLGSSGSVVPLFRKQIAEGGPVTVTHPEVIRYFMTIPEAAGLVLQCATQASGGEIFVLDMGHPIKIVDLAHRMIQLSGYEPEKDIEISFIGLRPGEKLFEELQHVGEKYTPTHHPKILRFTGEPYPLADVEAFLENISSKFGTANTESLKQMIKDFVPEYKPYIT
ncbi:MAG: polysaccharide biosynthesis protein [Puniceicoccaceae bacterium]